MERVKADAIRFIPEQSKLDVWSKKYFHDLTSNLLIKLDN